MFQSIFDTILTRLPPDPSGVLINTIVAIGIGIGALTALLGALHSRPTISMMLFATGTILGYCVPSWLDWDVNRSFTIALGGIIFGLVGFLLHRWCVAASLGILVAAVALVMFYDQAQASAPLTPISIEPSAQTTPAFSDDSPTNQILHRRWEEATPSFRKLAPWVALAAFVASAALAVFLPKIGMAALYSLGGTLLTLFSIGLGHASPKITWLDSLKSGPMTVAALGITMLLVGFLAQVGLVYRPASKQPEEQAATASQRRPEFG
jgi:hypothetical protein